jgi:DNA primase small subunit
MNELKLAIQKRQPHKIDIGAVFSAQPKDHMTIKADAFKTVERELVFDIDMTDYDNIRTCCTGANICLRCWPYMTMAIKVVDRTLREDFGYHHILWVYSGRRGVHCWVCDMSARELSNEARSAVVDYMSVELSSEKHGRSLNLHHPMIRRSYAILEPYFEKYIADGKLGQGLLESWDSYATILNTMPDDRVRQELSDKCERRQKRGEEYSGEERWRDLKEATSALSHGLDTKKRKLYAELEDWRINLVLTHCYPRLDANVSKMQNHLLKSPFCVHPKTGRVCVPIDPSMADEFNPFDVPTIRTLCHQVNMLLHIQNENSIMYMHLTSGRIHNRLTNMTTLTTPLICAISIRRI